MHRTIEILRGDAAPERRELPGAAAAGGSVADPIALPGAAPGAVVLEPAAAGLVVEARAAGVRAGGRPVAPGTRRLLRPGERVEVGNHAIQLPAEPAPEGTRAMAGALLRAAAAGESPTTAPHLVVLTGPRAGARLPLRGDQTLGRGRAATLRLADPEASRVHARVRVGAGAATVEDLGSKNGVRLNGVRVEAGPQPLRPGDELTIGETVLALADPLEALAPAPAPSHAAEPEPPPSPPRRSPPVELAAAALLALSAAALALAS